MLYILNFNDNFSTRDQITAQLDSRRDLVQDWYYCLTNSIFIESSLSTTQLRDFLLTISKEHPNARIFISTIKKFPLNDGWLPQPAWDFINKYSQP